MSTNSLIIEYGKKSPDIVEICSWIEARGFTRAQFKKGRDYISTFWGNRTIGFKLNERENFLTFYKEGPQGSLFVFEVSVTDKSIIYDFYSPLWIFGIWNIKLKFKPDAPWYARYLSVGYEIQKKFEKRFNSLK